MEELKYIHYPEIHNLDAPQVIVPSLINMFHPKSVVDVGCGVGTFLKVFLDNGIEDILGIDGTWVNKSNLFFPPVFFVEKDLEKNFEIQRKFDIVLCLEVAEHLSATVSDNFVCNLTSLGDIIIFSAAIINQGGQNHVNEQSFSYWIEKFNKRGFVFHDIFRKKFWNNTKINWWYKQNMFLVAHNSIDVLKYEIELHKSEAILEYVHPDLLALYANEIHRLKSKLNLIKQGHASYRLYLQLLRKKFASKFLE